MDWTIYRGATPDLWPRLWLCSNCGYYFWSHGDEQDPRGDGHCLNGRWLCDREAIAHA